MQEGLWPGGSLGPADMWVHVVELRRQSLGGIITDKISTHRQPEKNSTFCELLKQELISCAI